MPAALLVVAPPSIAPGAHADPWDGIVYTEQDLSPSGTFDEHCPEPNPNLCWSDESHYHEFYTPPDPLPPGKPGDVIKSEPQDTIRLEPSGELGEFVGRGTRIMYRSTDGRGHPTADTGTYIEPRDPWPGPGPRPVVAYLATPLGIGDQCAESRLLDQGMHFSSGQDLMMNLDETFIATMVGRGYGIVAVDTQGVGTPAPVPYNMLDPAGPPMLDALRAVQRLPGTSLDPHGPTAVWGFSANGGRDAAAAAEIAKDYAPELNIVGAFIEAPAADLTLFPPYLDGSAFMVAFAWTFNGVLTQYPEAIPLAASVLTPRGYDFIIRSRTQCLIEGMYDFSYRHFGAWGNGFGGAYFNTEPFELLSSGPVYDLLKAQTLGRRKPSMPVYLDVNRWDPFVSWQGTHQLALDWCDKGADVQMWTNYQTPFFQKLEIFNHVLPWWVDGERSLSWLTDRFNGLPTTPNCEQIRQED